MVRIARRAVVVCLLSAACCMGCAGRASVWAHYPHSKAPTLGQTSAEHSHKIHMIADYDRRALVDDLDVFFLTDRLTRLTRWH